MKLIQKQALFTRNVSKLIRFAYNIAEEAEEGFDVFLTFGRAYASEKANKADKGIDGSCHTVRLAVDLNLFVNGEYITGEHRVFHLMGSFWKKLYPDLARWGGDFRKKDYNHFSFTHNGKS